MLFISIYKKYTGRQNNNEQNKNEHSVGGNRRG